MEQNVLNTDLTGKVAVVTGASGTLCSIFAKALARAGAKVALLGRNMEKLRLWPTRSRSKAASPGATPATS